MGFTYGPQFLQERRKMYETIRWRCTLCW